MKHLFSALVGLMALASSPVAHAQIYEGRTLVETELIADTDAIVPGKPFRVGLKMTIAPHWHTYWQYAGDAGIPAEIAWKLPAGFETGAIQWPIPETILQPEGNLQTFAYSGEVLLWQEIRPPASLQPGAAIELQADASWLVCEELCIPGKASVALSLPVAATARPANAAEFDRWTARLPSKEPPDFSVTWTRSGDQLTATVSPPSGIASVEFFPLPAAEEIIGHTSTKRNGDGTFTVSVESKTDLRGVLAVKGPDGERGWDVTAQATAAPAKSAPVSPASLWTVLAFGFLGGLILNLMPCVLPVISLKIFGFVRQAGQSRRRIALHGLAFSAGIFAWFLGLAAAIVAFRSGDDHGTWGGQFQNPWFILFIATLVFAFALNLFGVFELALPGRAANTLSEAGSHEGYTGSFFQGAFATLLATPCTGPFLGPTLTFAFTQAAPLTFAVFASMAAGMALPYFALAIQPGWIRFLPKPGAWMERLKQFMGFPMLAALLWLLFVMGGLLGVKAVIWTGAFLLTLGLALWIYGQSASPVVKPRARALGLLSALLIAVAGGWLFVGQIFAKDLIAWVPYSQSTVDRLIEEGKPVFVDFTADWCLSCKFNERTAIDTAAVRRAIADQGIVMVKADWTNSNPEITAALQRFGRVGVPFCVLYPAGKSDAPLTLPELLTESIVLEAFGKAR